jgi:succinoglycan biosynthesis protein ExoL
MSDLTKKTLIIFPHLPNPRMIKRIDLFKSLSDVKVVYWDRKLDFNKFNEVPKGIETKVISRKANEGNPLRRIHTTIYVLCNIWVSINKYQPDILYVSKTDMLLVSALYKLVKAKKVKLLYEVSDIHPLLIDKQKKLYRRMASFIIKKAEKYLCKKVNLLVVTSEYFYEKYYFNFINSENMFFFPNTPVPSVFNGYHRQAHKKYTVGFIGAIRYPKQIEYLIDLAKECDINVFIAGKGIEFKRIEKYSENNENVEIYGEYVYKEEIRKLYEKVDCIYSVYDANLENVKIALPNRLYESVYTNTPIIAAKGTYLGDIVEKNEIGITVESKNLKELENAIIKLKEDQNIKLTIKANTDKLKDIWRLDGYNSRLIEKLKDLGVL